MHKQHYVLTQVNPPPGNPRRFIVPSHPTQQRDGTTQLDAEHTRACRAPTADFQGRVNLLTVCPRWILTYAVRVVSTPLCREHETGSNIL